MKKQIVVVLYIFLIISCNSKDSQVLDTKKWNLYEVMIENFDTHNLVNYYQEIGPNGNKGYAELTDDGGGNIKFIIYDGKGNPFVKSTLIKSDEFSGGYEGTTEFYNKPNERKTNQLLLKSGNPFQSKERTVRDIVIETHSIVRFIPMFFSNEGIDIEGVQFDVPATRESIFVKLVRYGGNPK